MNALVASPVLIPMLTAILCVAAWNRLRLQRVISVLGALALLAVSVWLIVLVDSGGAVSTQFAGWAAPYGIAFVADRFATIMVLLNGISAIAVVIYSLGSIDERRESMGYHALLHALIGACSGAFLSGDLFNIYVWFEVMLMSSFVLLTLGGERGQLEGAIKYVTLNLLSSVIFLSGLGLLYGTVGSLNMADIGLRIRAATEADIPVLTALSVLFLTAFGVKAAAFPFFFWLPASYHTPPPAISALFAGLLTKVGVYALIRVFTVVFTTDPHIMGPIISVIAALTMITGVLGAAAQFEIRRILSFHIVSQIGYMLMGLGVAIVANVRADRLAETLGADAPDTIAMRSAAAIALAGSVFYILHHIIVKTNLFLVAGVVLKLKGCAELKHIGGLYRSNPMLALLFMIPAMSLAGIPILSGFWAKFAIVRAGLQAETYGIVIAALFVSALTLFSMVKIWAEAFWKDQPEGDPRAVESYGAVGAGAPFKPALMYAPIIGLAVITLCIGVGAGPAWNLAERAANDLLDPVPYTEAVLGEPGLQRLAALGLYEFPAIDPIGMPIETASDSALAPTLADVPTGVTP
ncbi:MAG: proton-conducting transporter membrane subunit [Planctomycetota bacterium]